jgi:hypothetical protein
MVLFCPPPFFADTFKCDVQKTIDQLLYEPDDDMTRQSVLQLLDMRTHSSTSLSVGNEVNPLFRNQQRLYNLKNLNTTR